MQSILKFAFYQILFLAPLGYITAQVAEKAVPIFENGGPRSFPLLKMLPNGSDMIFGLKPLLIPMVMENLIECTLP